MKCNRILRLFFLAIMIAGAPAPLRAQTRADKIVFSIPSRSIAAIDLYIAKERGFFRDESLDVDIVQIRGNVAVAAALSGQVQATNGVGTVIRALERSEIPLKILTVSLKRNLFWLVARKEITSIAQLKGKILGTTTFGGSQHTAATRLIRKGGLDPDKDLTVVVGGDVPAQLQSLITGAIDAAALSPPTVVLARDKFHMNILGSAMEDVSNLQNGTAVTEKFLRENKDILRRILRARAKANRYFWENERGTSEVLAKFQNVDLAVARIVQIGQAGFHRGRDSCSERNRRVSQGRCRAAEIERAGAGGEDFRFFPAARSESGDGNSLARTPGVVLVRGMVI